MLKTTGLRDSPADVPQTGVHDDDVWFGILTKVWQDWFHIGIVASCNKVKAEEVILSVILSDLLVVHSICHLPFTSTFDQFIPFKTHLPLKYIIQSKLKIQCLGSISTCIEIILIEIIFLQLYVLFIPNNSNTDHKEKNKTEY